MTKRLKLSALQVRELVGELVDYLYHDEEKDFHESGKPRKHIFRAVKDLNDWLGVEREKY